MAKLTKIQKALNTLKEEDLICLQHLYLYRILTVKQIMQNIYKLRENQTRKRNAILRRLLDLDVVEMVEYKPEQHALELTSTGVNIVRKTKDIPTEIFDEDAKTVKRGYYTAGELKMKTNLMNHQLTKNNFMLKFQKLVASSEFKKWCKKWHLNFKYQYFDEKYLTTYVLMRPDSVFHVGNTDFFVEEDMATESAAQLKDKWRHYREFMQTREFYMKENKIIVLFLTDNILKQKSIDKRKALVRETALTIMGDKFKNQFDMIIGSQDEIISIMPDLIADACNLNDRKLQLINDLQKHHWQITDAYSINQYFNNEDYWLYIRQLDQQNNLIRSNFRYREFLIDDYYHRPMAIQHRIMWHDHNNIIFQNRFKRPLQYIVLIDPTEKEMTLKDVQQANAQFDSNVFYSTYWRLQNLPLNSALFQWDHRGKMYCFTDDELVKRDYNIVDPQSEFSKSEIKSDKKESTVKEYKHKK